MLPFLVLANHALKNVSTVQRVSSVSFDFRVSEVRQLQRCKE